MSPGSSYGRKNGNVVNRCALCSVSQKRMHRNRTEKLRIVNSIGHRNVPERSNDSVPIIETERARRITATRASLLKKSLGRCPSPRPSYNVAAIGYGATGQFN